MSKKDFKFNKQPTQSTPPAAVAEAAEETVSANTTAAEPEQVEKNVAIESTTTASADPVPPVTSEIPVVQVKPETRKSSTSTQKGFKPVYKVQVELSNYAEAMDKKNSMVPEQGGKWQYGLFKAIKSIFLAKTQEEFNNEFNTVLDFFNKNKDGIFNEKFIFRFPESWAGSQAEYTQNRRLIFLIIQTADPKNRRKALEQINMETVAEGMLEAQKQMLFNFYQM